LELKARTSADVKAAGVLCIEDLDGKTKKKIDEQVLGGAPSVACALRDHPNCSLGLDCYLQVTRLLMKLDAVEVDTELRVIRKKL